MADDDTMWADFERSKVRQTLAQSLKDSEALMPQMIESVRLAAKITRERFLALKNEGFTDEQSIELCQKPFVA